MTVSRTKRCLALNAGMLLACGLCAAAEITIMKEDYGQFHYKTDRLGQSQSDDTNDVTTQRVRQILDKADVDYRIQLRTWPISYRRAANRPDYGIFPLEKTPEQMDTFTFVGPLATYKWVVYIRSNSDLRIDSLDDLRGLDMGGYQNSSFTRYLTEQGIEVDELPFDALNLKKLTLGYIDAWATYDVNAERIAREAHYPTPKAAWVVKSVDIYLGINRETDKKLLGAIMDASPDF